jgi:membrane-bound metal-dependent hydrolase YbcI (DUF457 family)
MFIGHFAVGLGAKAVAPRVSLGTLFLATQFVDLLWPTLLLLGWERVVIAPGASAGPLDFVHYPISHSLLMVGVWSLLFAGIYRLVRRSWTGAFVLGGAVVSHWLLDLVVHRPDLPLWPGTGPHVGLGLWNAPVLTLAVEGLLFAVGVGLYLRATRPTRRLGTHLFAGLAVALVLVHLSNVFGPPPESVPALAWGAQLQWLFVAWAYGVDRFRAPRAALNAPAAPVPAVASASA